MADQKIGGGYIEISAQGVEQTETAIEGVETAVASLSDQYDAAFADIFRSTTHVTGASASFAQQTAATTKVVAQAAVATKIAEKEVYDLADSYELLEHEMDKVVEVTNRVGRANLGFDFATIRIDAGLRRTSETSRGFGSSLKGMQQQITAASYAFQDFASTTGDLGAKFNSITNNLPMILAGMGGLGQVVSISAVGALALYRNWDHIAGLFEHTNAIPKAVGELDQLKQSLKETSDQMEKLAEKGFLTDSELVTYKNLQAAEKELKDTIKTRQVIENLKNEKTDAEQQVAKAFHEAIHDAGPRKILEQLEKELKTNANPALKGLFEKIIGRINKGERNAFDALIEYMKAEPGKYGNLAKELEDELRKAMRGGKDILPMDDIAKVWKEKNKKIVHDLNQQGQDIQSDMLGDIAKEAEQGIQGIFAKPLEEFVIHSKYLGVGARKEISHLRDEIERDVRKLNPELEKAFPKVFKEVVDGIVVKVREGVDKAVKQLQALEGLTREQALRRLEAAGAERKQGNAERLAQDEFAALAARQYQQMRAFNPGMAPLTPEMRRQMGEQMQAQLKDMGVSPQGQNQIAGLLRRSQGNPGLQQQINHALGTLVGAGFDQAGALQQLPAVFAQMRRGGGVEQAVERILLGQMRQFEAAMNGRARGGGAGFQSVPPTAATGQQLNNTQKLLTIAGQLNAENARQQQQIVRQGREIDALSRNVATRQRTALSRPGG